METSKEEGKRFVQVPELDDEGEDDEDTAGEDNKKKGALTPSKRRVSGAGGSTHRSCQAEDCTADMADAKPYHRRHKVCEFHAKAAVVLLSGSRQRFCQQCSRASNEESYQQNTTYASRSALTFSTPCAGFMNYQSLMRLKGAVVGVWQGIMSGVARVRMILTEKRCIEINVSIEEDLIMSPGD